MTSSLPPRCPVAYARSAQLLLQSGRAEMALRLLELLPDAIEAQLIAARRCGFTDGWHAHLAADRRAEAETHGTPKTSGHSEFSRPPPPKPTRLDWLRDALADPAKREQARAALRMDDHLLDRIAAGTATLSGDSLAPPSGGIGMSARTRAASVVCWWLNLVAWAGHRSRRCRPGNARDCRPRAHHRRQPAMSHTAAPHRIMDRAFAEAMAREGGDLAHGHALVASRNRLKDVRTMSSHRVLLTTLSHRTSTKGNEYLAGWLGKASVVAFPGEADKFGNPTWDVFLKQPEPRDSPPAPQQRGQAREEPAVPPRCRPWWLLQGLPAGRRDGPPRARLC